MTHAILFDLDDTLYAERDFFRSGFAVVASELERRGVGRSSDIQIVLESIHVHQGRNNVFDQAARRLGFPEPWVPELVDLFRCHDPRICLERSTREILVRLRGDYRLGIVTDGYASVQRKKIGALGLSNLIDHLVVSDDLGRSYWKPSPIPFLQCCEALGVTVDDAIVVGDNPERDILGARNASMRCIRIRRAEGYFRGRDDCAWPQPDGEINRLQELEGLLEHLKAVSLR